MMIDEMGIRLIDEIDIGEYIKPPKPPRRAKASRQRQGGKSRRCETVVEDVDGEEIDLNLDAELAEASTKRIDDPVRMYLTQMGEIPLLTREQEIALAKKIEITRKIFRSKVLESDYCLQSGGRDPPAGGRRRPAVRPHDEDQHRRGPGRQGHDRPAHPDEPGSGPRDARAQPRRVGRAAAEQEQEGAGRAAPARSAAAAAAA